MNHKNTTTKNNFEKLITVNELSDLIGFKKTFIHKAKDSLDLPFYKIGGAIRFRLSEVNGWLEQRKVIAS